MATVTQDEENAVADAYNVHGSDWPQIIQYMIDQNATFSQIYILRTRDSLTRRLRSIVQKLMQRYHKCLTGEQDVVLTIDFSMVKQILSAIWL